LTFLRLKNSMNEFQNLRKILKTLGLRQQPNFFRNTSREMCRKLIFIPIILFLFSCNEIKEKSNEIDSKANIEKLFENDSLTVLLNSNKEFLKDSLLNENSGIIESYFSKYQSDSCGILTYKNSELKENFEGVNVVKGIRPDKQNDTVFVVPAFNYCEEGDSYYFFDKSLPRLQTDSYCCHPANFFVISDIDEDGTNEIGIFYSTCVSRYKSLRIYTLKDNDWKEIGTSDFDVLTQDPSKVNYSDLVRKISKNKFEICNFWDGKTEWRMLEFGK